VSCAQSGLLDGRTSGYLDSVAPYAYPRAIYDYVFTRDGDEFDRTRALLEEPPPVGMTVYFADHQPNEWLVIEVREANEPGGPTEIVLEPIE
jgi:hypothetical protein